MLSIACLIVRCNPNGPLALDGAFVLADPAADAALGIDIGALKSDLDVNNVSCRRGFGKRIAGINFQMSGCVADDFMRREVGGLIENTIIIPGCILIRLEDFGIQFNPLGSGSAYDERPANVQG